MMRELGREYLFPCTTHSLSLSLRLTLQQIAYMLNTCMKQSHDDKAPDCPHVMQAGVPQHSIHSL